MASLLVTAVNGGSSSDLQKTFLILRKSRFFSCFPVNMWYCIGMNDQNDNLVKQIAAGRVPDRSPVRGYFYRYMS